MRFHFFALKDVQRASSIKDGFSGIYMNYARKIDTLSNYNIIILIGVITLLLVLYSFVAYSFLESSSALLFKSNNRTQVPIENRTAFKDSIYTYRYTGSQALGSIYSTTRYVSKNSLVSTLHAFFQKYVRPVQKGCRLVSGSILLYISKSIADMDFLEFLQNTNKTILSQIAYEMGHNN